MNQLDDERTRAWVTLMRAHGAVAEALENELQGRRGLPLSWYEVLVGLAQAPGGRLRMQDLARWALLSKSGLSRLVDRMEGAGLVRRESCPADRRGTNAAITEEGTAALREATPAFVDAFEEHVARHLTLEDAAALQGILGRILEANGHAASFAPQHDCGTGLLAAAEGGAGAEGTGGPGGQHAAERSDADEVLQSPWPRDLPEAGH